MCSILTVTYFILPNIEIFSNETTDCVNFLNFFLINGLLNFY